MTSGYLAPVAYPHVYRHVPERFHGVLHELAQPIAMAEVARNSHYDKHYIQNHVLPVIRDDLHLYAHGNDTAWRAALVRLYYGIDKCWCAP